MAFSKYSGGRGRRGYGSKAKYGGKGKSRERWNGSRYGGGRYRRYGYGGGVSSRMKSYVQREVEKVRLGPRRQLCVKVASAEEGRWGRKGGSELQIHIEGPESVKNYAFLPVTALVAPQRHLAMPNPAYRLGNEVMIKGVRLTFDVMQTDQVRFMVFAFRNVKREQGVGGQLPYDIHRAEEVGKGVAQMPDGVSFLTLSKEDVFGVGKVAGQMMLNGGPFLVNTAGDDWRTSGDSAFSAPMDQKALLGKWSVEVDRKTVSTNAKVAAHNFKVDGGMRAGGTVSQKVSAVRCYCDFGSSKVRYLSALSSDGADKSVELFVMWECPRGGVADAKAMVGAAVANVSMEVYYRG